MEVPVGGPVLQGVQANLKEEVFSIPSPVYPLFFGIVFSTYKDAVLRDTPVGIVITQENVTPAQVRAVVAIARTFSRPTLKTTLMKPLNGSRGRSITWLLR